MLLICEERMCGSNIPVSLDSSHYSMGSVGNYIDNGRLLYNYIYTLSYRFSIPYARLYPPYSSSLRF
jgi:hypothetical protein